MRKHPIVIQLQLLYLYLLSNLQLSETKKPLKGKGSLIINILNGIAASMAVVKETMKKKINNNNNKHDAEDDDDNGDTIFWTNTTTIPPILIISVCVKIMLFPTYRSTDFDVHRNWLAITYNLPLSQWYFDDIDGQTVHTLDYPPNFAYFEYLLANNPITKYIINNNNDNDTCLDLLPDTNNEPSDLCIVFQRSTVIISDLILWIGAWIACTGMYSNNNDHQDNNDKTTKSKSKSKCCVVKSFLLIVLNPGLIWLDHIHFQYNGMMLGILLASIGLLLHAANMNDNNNTSKYHLFNLGGAVLYGILVNFKHLYLTLGPLYFVYLLKTYCLEDHTSNNNNNSNNSNKLLVNRFMLLAVVTASTLILPWIPFLITEETTAKEQIIQILSRLFPFGRGLVHDYWAANVWALYLLADKVLRFVSTKLPSLLPIQSLPEPSPGQCAILLLTSMIPGLYLIWTKTTMPPPITTTTTSSSNNKNNSNTHNNINNNKRLLIQGVVYCSLCSFMLAYHVHEKAILTALIPMTLLIEYDTEDTNSDFDDDDYDDDDGDSNDGGRNKSNNNKRIINFLFLQVTIFGLLGLFPLLFRPVELSFKLVSYVVYVTLCCCWVKLSDILPKSRMIICRLQRVSLLVVMAIITLLEFVPILHEGKYEFLPLMLTSTVCAVDLVLCWIVVLCTIII